MYYLQNRKQCWHRAHKQVCIVLRRTLTWQKLYRFSLSSVVQKYVYQFFCICMDSDTPELSTGRLFPNCYVMQNYTIYNTRTTQLYLWRYDVKFGRDKGNRKICGIVKMVLLLVKSYVFRDELIVSSGMEKVVAEKKLVHHRSTVKKNCWIYLAYIFKSLYMLVVKACICRRGGNEKDREKEGMDAKKGLIKWMEECRRK